MRRGTFQLVALLTILAGLICTSVASAASDSFLADVQVLTEGDHRLAGTPELAAAADHVATRLRELGIEEVFRQEFDLPQTKVHRCELVLDGQDTGLPLLPMRPNGIRPPTTPPEGITGELLNLGTGSLEDLAGRDPFGKIVVMDYNASDHWMRAFRLGARAVIFVRTSPTESHHYHALVASGNLPRFYYSGPASDLADGSVATVYSKITWTHRVGQNVFAFLPGTDPEFDMEREEMVILAAHLDSYGEVPRASPGGQGAANCAALLQLAEQLRDNPPRRHVLIAFLDAQARSHAGSSAFYAALEEDEQDAPVAERLAGWQEETEFLAAMAALAEQGDPLSAAQSETGKPQLVRRLQSKAKQYSDELKKELAELRTERSPVNKPTDERVAELTELIAERQEAKDQWNDLRRDLGKKELQPKNQAAFDDLLDSVLADIRARQAELVQEERFLRSALQLRDRLIDKWITLHVSLLLTDESDRWGLLIGGDAGIGSNYDQGGLYGKIQASFVRAYNALIESGRAATAAPHFDLASADGSVQDPRLLWSAPTLLHSGEIAGRFGIYNLALGTVHSRLPREGTPDDRPESLDLDRIETFAGEIGRLLSEVANQEQLEEAVADQEGLSLRRAIAADKQYIVPELRNGNPSGTLVMGRKGGSSFADTPIGDAVVQIYLTDPWYNLFWHHKKTAAFDNYIVTMSNQNGAYSVGPIPKEAGGGDMRGIALLFDERGDVVMASDRASTTTVLDRLNAFYCRDGVYMMPPSFWPDEPTFMDALANSVISGDTETRALVAAMDGIAYWYTEDKIDAVKIFGENSVVALGIDPEAEKESRDLVYGSGFPLDSDWLARRNAEQAAADLWHLNESRLGILRDRDVMNSSVEELHGRVEDLIDSATATPSPLKREALSASAFMGGAPIYEMTRSTMDDLVTAVLILLALCVPFAFALERLLIGSTGIYKQVAWFTGFFSLTFLLLYSSHPAFAIAKTPAIIFLGFAVVVLSGMVIFIIMQKFETELKALQGMTANVHAADVSRFNTVMAAMSMGISTMRRRPLRTALTAVTIILLTFTILCFASFDTQKGIVKLFSAPSPPYTGVALHRAAWGSYNQEFVDMVIARWHDEADVCPRYWVCPEFAGDPDFLIAQADASNPVAMKGILGLTTTELERRGDLRELLGIDNLDRFHDQVFMTEAVAELVGVEPGDRVLVKGHDVEVGPLLSAAELSAAQDMDGSSILPVDFISMSQQGGAKAGGGDGLESQQTWTSLPIDSIVILAADRVRWMGARPHVISFYTEDSTTSTVIAEDLARMLDKSPIVATRQNGVYRHVLGTVVAASGVGDLFFPILLGGLVIFGTMLGSVADREKEIYTFSALGLAPPHVASLFFSEALVYSVIGGLGGYLIAQGSMKLLGVMAMFGWVQVPEMNYSSTNAIVTILIVMATVMVSAIYPAIKASKSANPGLLRAWRLPTPEGDRFDLDFPFTVSEYDLTGVVSFLQEHFAGFSDTGLGSFMATDPQVVRFDDGNLGVKTRLALAPFDLGVTQRFELRSKPSEIEGIDEVKIRLTRLSGQPKDWARLNKILLNDLRRQFLLWRSLPKETMDYYRMKTLQDLEPVD